MDTVTIITLAISIATAIGTLVGYRTAARKTDLDVLRGIIAELRLRIEELETENERLQQRIEELETENRRLRSENDE